MIFLTSSARRIAAAVCSCFLCAVFLISILSFNSSAFDSVPSMTKAFIHDGTSVNLVADAVLNSQTGLYTLTTSQPLYNNNPSRDFYCIGSMFIPSSGEGFDSTSKYQYTISLVLSAGNSFKTVDPTAYGLFHTSLDNNNRPIVADASFVTYEPEIIVDGSVYTFSFNDISYESIVNSRLIYMQTSYDNVTTYTVNSNGIPYAEVSLLNVYFGLTSDFDQDAYNKEIINKLDSIDFEIGKTNEKLDNIEGAVSDVGNKVDEVGDQISGEIDDLQQSMETQHIKEEEYSKDKSDSAVNDVTGALDDSGLTPSIDDMWTGLKRLFSCLSTTETIQTIPIPEVKIPILSGTGFDSEVVLIPDQDYDLSQILNNPSIQTLIKGAKVLYYLFFFYFMVDYLRKIFAKLFLTDVATNEAANVK